MAAGEGEQVTDDTSRASEEAESEHSYICSLVCLKMTKDQENNTANFGELQFNRRLTERFLHTRRKHRKRRQRLKVEVLMDVRTPDCASVRNGL